MSPEFAWDILNGYIKKDIKSGLGIIKQRDGVTKFNTVTFTNACKTAFEAKWNSGTKDVIIREGTRWAKYNDATSTFDVMDTGRTDGSKGMAVMFGNELIMVDGGTPRKCTSAYSVSDLSSDASMPADSTAVHVHQHKVWLNSSSNPMKAYYSKTDSANAADSWSAAGDAGNLDFSLILPRGDTLLGFATFAEVFLVFIFKRYAVVYTCGSDPSGFTLQQIIPLNCISPYGIQQVGNDLAVCSLEGVNSFRSSLANQDLDVDDLTKYIAPLYRALISAVTDKTDISMGFSHNLNHLYVGIPSPSAHQILVYSLDIKNFVGRWQGYKCYCFCEREDGTMLVGGDGYLYKMNDGSDDDGSAISFQYSFPYLYFDSADINKAPRQVEGLIKHESDLTLYMDYWYDTNVYSANKLTKSLTLNASSSLYRSSYYRTAYYRATGNTRFLTSDIVGRGKQMAIDIRHSTSGANVEIPYLIIRVAKESRRVL